MDFETELPRAPEAPGMARRSLERCERISREVPFSELRGRGLSIVEAGSSRWGIHEGTTHVWAEIEREGPRLGRHEKPD